MDAFETQQGLEPVRLDFVAALRNAVSDKSSPLRYPILASVDADGLPQARVVILREFDPDTMVLRVFTDARSPKMSQITLNPQVQFVFYDQGQKLHFRVSGSAVTHHQNDVTEAYWKDLPEFGRGDYLSRLPPGADIVQPEDGWRNEDQFGSDNFTVLEIRVSTVDWLKLSAGGHKRARLSWEDGECHGQWVTP